MVEKNPWWKNVQGPFPKWEGPIGCKEDGGGSHRGRGTVGKMLIHRAVNNHDKEGTGSPRQCSCLYRLGPTKGCATSLAKQDAISMRPSARSMAVGTTGIIKLVEAHENVSEVEGAGNTPLHCAAYEGWAEGVQLLLSLGAKVNASNNAGDRPWHWARNMDHQDVMALLERVRSIMPQSC